VRLSSAPITKSVRDLKKDPQSTNGAPVLPRPAVREDCLCNPRPCPWVGCKHHLYLDVAKNGSIKFNFPNLSPLDLKETCSLDISDRGETTLDKVGNLMNLSRERIRQIEVKLLMNLKNRIHRD